MVAARPPASKAAPQPARCCTRAGCFGCTRATCRPFARVAAVIRAAPSVLFLPLLLFSACVIGGVIAVRYAANAYAEAERTKATSLANTAATAFASLLESTLYPLLVVSHFIENGGDASHANVYQFWVKTAPQLVSLSPAIDDVQIAPYGVATNIYPLVTKRRNATGVIVLGGHDLFNASSPVANRRTAAIAALTSRAVMIEGPKSLLLPTSTPCTGSACNVNPLLGILARSGSYVTTTQAGDTWSNGFTWPGVLPGQVLGPITGVTNCTGVLVPSTGRSYCDTNATGDGTRFWGFSTVIVMWSNLLELSRVTELGDTAGRPYKWSVSRNLESASISGSFPWTFVSANAGPLPPYGTPGYSEGITATVKVFTSAWSFTLEKSGGWHPEWEAGIVAGVVLVSALIAVFSFLLSLERNLHLELLYSMLPRRMVAKLHTGGFAESFDHVVILFSDIVSYTDLVGTLTPVQTMTMLNELFADFDSLVDKHGIIKVETIGDGYLCVAGAPSPTDPEAQARAMASMALDMIEASRRHRAPDGSLLRIRVGLHAGPVMAGVVGRKMPRWCLFGDTVNTASRMESSSSAMRCQVSQQVAALLEAAVAEPGTRLALQSRGRVSIKGKGELETFWLSSTRDDPADSMRAPAVDRISTASSLEEYGASPSRADALQVQVEGGASV